MTEGRCRRAESDCVFDKMKSQLSLIAVLFFFALLVPSRVKALSPIEVHFIDVGQGDAILIKGAEGVNVLIDAGGLSAGHRVGKYLKGQGVFSLRALVFTHMHPDHVGGIFGLLPGLDVEKVYDNGVSLHGNVFWEEYGKLVSALDLPRDVLRADCRLDFGDMSIRVLSPFSTFTGDMNADSIVMMLRYGEIRFLMAGDLNFKGEKRLLEKEIDLKCDVLKVAHHGACDSTSKAFLKSVAPRIAVISVGLGNRNGYPCEETLGRIENHVQNVYRTDRHKTIVIRTDGVEIKVLKGEE